MTQKAQHLLPPYDDAQRRYSDSSAASASQSEQAHITTQSGAARKTSDTTSEGSTLATPSTDGYLHLPSPPGSPMLHHRRFVLFLSSLGELAAVYEIIVSVMMFFHGKVIRHSLNPKFDFTLSPVPIIYLAI